MLILDDEVLPLEDDVEDKEQDEEHAEGHHDMEGVEYQGNIWHEVLGLLHIVVAEVVEILLQPECLRPPWLSDSRPGP